MANLQVRAIYIPPFEDLAGARQVLSQQLQNLQQSIASQLPLTDFNGSRLTNVGPPQQMNDAVTLGYLQQLFIPQSASIGSGSGATGKITLTEPVEFLVSGSPVVNGNGNLIVSKSVQPPHFFWGGGTSTSAIVPVFRAIAASDLPIATTTSLGIVEPDGTSITVTTAGVLSGHGLTLSTSANLSTNTAAKTILAFTPTSTGLYQVNAYITVTAIAVDHIQMQLVWTDLNSVTQTVNWNPQGLSSPVLAAMGVYLLPTLIVQSGMNPITIQTNLTLGGGTINYDAGASILKVS